MDREMIASLISGALYEYPTPEQEKLCDHIAGLIEKAAALTAPSAPAQGGVNVSELRQALNEFEDFINLPSQYENQTRVRDYRYELWSKWTDLAAALRRALGQEEAGRAV